MVARNVRAAQLFTVFIARAFITTIHIKVPRQGSTGLLARSDGKAT
jgi:hypothetical protein